MATVRNSCAKMHAKRPPLLKKLHQVKVGTINVTTAREDSRLEECARQCARAGLTFCALQETKRKGQGSKIVETTDRDGKPAKFEFHWAGHKSKPKHGSLAGTGLLIRTGHATTVEDVEFVGARLITATVVHFGTRYYIMSTYNPTEEATDAQKDACYANLRKYIKLKPKKAHLILLGDFNATSTAASTFTRFRGNTQLAEGHTANDNGQRLLDLARTHDLAIMNSFWRKKACHSITWHSNDGVTRKTLDYILCSGLLSSLCTNARTRNSYDFMSDHRLYVLTIRQPLCKQDRLHHRQPKPKPDPLKRRNVKDLRDCSEYPAKVSNAIKRISADHPASTISERCNNLIEALRDAAIDSLPEQPKDKVNAPWRTDTKILALLASRDGMDRNHPRYKAISKEIKRTLKSLQNDHFAAEAAEINSYAEARNIERAFRRAKQQQSTLKDVQNAGCDMNSLRDHFKQHFTCAHDKPTPASLYAKPPEFMSALLQVSAEHNINNDAPSADELKANLRRLKNNRAANDIPPELMKYAVESDTYLTELQNILETVWTTKSVPEAWGISKLATLWKAKGSRKDAKMYRGLSISSSLCKIAVCIIISRFTGWYESQLSEPQQGFRRNRGTQDAIHTAKATHQLSARMRRPVYCAFIDLTAAFDTINRSWLWQSVRNRLLRTQATTNLEVLEALYAKTSAYLSSDPDKKPFETVAGVRQGGPESPMYFCLFMDWIMREFQERAHATDLSGFKFKYRVPIHATDRRERAEHPVVGDLELLWVAFADDVLLCFESAADLRRGLLLLVELLDEFDLHISEKKTETLIMNAKFDSDVEENGYPESLLSIHGETIKNVKSFRYLGSWLHEAQPATGNVEIDARIQAAKFKFGELKSLLQNHRINLGTRMTFYNAFIRARLTYACQTWTLTSAQKRRLNSTHSTLLRHMIRGGFRRVSITDNDFRYKNTNEQILHFCKSTPLEQFINDQRRKFAAHTIRQPNYRHTKQLLFNCDKYKQPGNRVGTLLEQAIANDERPRDEFIRAARKREF